MELLMSREQELGYVLIMLDNQKLYEATQLQFMITNNVAEYEACDTVILNV